MFRTIGLILLMATALGCASVPQYKRGTLARKHMTFDADGDEEVLENHLVGAREEATGAAGARGGGCGCN